MQGVELYQHIPGISSPRTARDAKLVMENWKIRIQVDHPRGRDSAAQKPGTQIGARHLVRRQFLGIDNVVVARSPTSGTNRVYNITFGGTQTGINMQTFFGDAANISNQSVRSITTTYNAAGELLSVNDPSSDVSFVRDNLGRATTVSSTVNGVGFSMGQSFDIVGNRTELRASGSGTPDFRNIYRYDKLNRLTEVIQTNQVGVSLPSSPSRRRR